MNNAGYNVPILRLNFLTPPETRFTYNAADQAVGQKEAAGQTASSTLYSHTAFSVVVKIYLLRQPS